MDQLALWLLVLLPAVTGAVLCLAPRERGVVPVSLAAAALTTALSVWVSLARPEVATPFVAGSDLALAVDPLSALLVPTVAAVTTLVLVAASGEIRESRARFHGLMLLFAAAALVTATATTLPTLLLAWEVMGATSYALIGFWWRDSSRVSAGLMAFVTTRAADLGLYLAAAAALAGGAGLALADLPASSEGWRHVLAAGVVVAALGKAAQLPFSFWLSGAMAGPSPVSALLHSAAMVALGGYLLLRTEPLLAATGWAADAAAWAGALTALLLGAVALAQRDLKQLLAASTAAQLGFVVMAAGLASVGAGAAHLVAHASTKALLFLVAGVWLASLGTKSLPDLRGAARRWPVVGATVTVGALALAGLVPLSLWATKDAVLAAALERSTALYVVGLAAAALSAAYAGKVLFVVWRRVPVATGDGGTGRVGAVEQVPLVVLALGAAVLGVLALPPVGDALARALGGDPVHPSLLEMAVSTLVVPAVLVLVWWRGVPEPGWARAWLGLETAVRRAFVEPTVALARLLAALDDRVIDRAVHGAAAGALGLARRMARLDDVVLDGAVEGAARSTDAAGRWSRRADDRGLDGLVEGLAALARRLGRLARMPQTGQLHHYYIQAIGVLAIAVLLLVTVR